MDVRFYHRQQWLDEQMPFLAGAALFTIVAAVIFIIATHENHYWRTRNFSRAAIVSALGVTAFALPCVIVMERHAVLYEHEIEEGAICAENMHELGTALAQYTSDCDNRYPPADLWESNIKSSTYLPSRQWRSILHCPAAKGQYGYAMNINLSDRDSRSITQPDSTVLLFESDSNTIDAAGTAANVSRPRHIKLNLLWSSGNMYQQDSPNAKREIWKPAPENN